MMFRAFFDESGLNPGEDKALIIGGFFGRVEEWKKASDAWDEYLHLSPKIGYFSHNEANSLSGEFATFSRESSDAKVLGLAGVISKFELLGFCASVPHCLFASRNRKASRKTMGTRVYDWGFLAATSGVLQYMENNLKTDEKVDFVFDERSELKACISTYNEMKSSGLVRTLRCAGECRPGDDKKLPALQMADLLTWEFSGFVKNGFTNEPFKAIARRNKVIHIHGAPPSLLGMIFAVQKMGRDVQDDSASILKRIYKDKEKTVKLLNDTIELIRGKEVFDIQMQRLTSLH